MPLWSNDDDAVGDRAGGSPEPFLISVHPIFFGYPVPAGGRVPIAGFIDPDTAREVKIGWGRHSEKLLGENDGVAR